GIRWCMEGPPERSLHPEERIATQPKQVEEGYETETVAYHHSESNTVATATLSKTTCPLYVNVTPSKTTSPSDAQVKFSNGDRYYKCMGLSKGMCSDRIATLMGQILGNIGVSFFRTPEGFKLKMPRHISFSSGQYALLPSFYQTFDSVVLVFKTFDKTRIRISGHTDSSEGDDGYPRSLSEKRASAVAGYFAGQGVARARMLAVGFGERFPMASNSTERGRATNRRVEIDIFYPK
ncbi:MAG: OmpA family protein, partial [Gammaproteobacteria bacterium]|nr:OmpA family protein [Gammaproteobacteria bacterium]